jgi:hypothetical protein
MVVLRCTRQLLMRLKYPDEDTSAQSTTRLGAWYGALIRFGRRHVLLFISERSRLPVMLPARDADWLALAFPMAVSGTLMGLGVPTAAVEQERSSMLPIAIGPTRNRSRGLHHSRSFNGAEHQLLYFVGKLTVVGGRTS